ncbi:hypothetical protein BCR34DRAFT_220725 [Clohesyomyces aquaticus]|uniref:Condensation domain-containing protein n=1 Tax=Clohesyomyces aquaticus TaxID=1231657 RepID=A0A1Y1Y957_9PLEO|nr:hypothetical protein BCR34DRAFT_220725 [Clohesyomyces aquaticus]
MSLLCAGSSRQRAPRLPRGTPVYIVNAIARIVLAQPHLHVGIVGETSKHPGFVRLERLDLRNHVQWKIVDDSGQREDVYREAMQTQLDSRFEHLSTRPGWRVVVVYEPVAEIMAVVYVWNHVHHDGMSGNIFHRHLLRHLNNYPFL